MFAKQLTGPALAILFSAWAASAVAQDSYVIEQPYAAESGGEYQAGDAGYEGSPGGDYQIATPYTFYPQSPPSLSYNYYYPVPTSGNWGARLYLCPRPTPPHVGYTYITYQAFAPHEYLYRHRATYITSHPGNLTITRVKWR